MSQAEPDTLEATLSWNSSRKAMMLLSLTTWVMLSKVIACISLSFVCFWQIDSFSLLTICLGDNGPESLNRVEKITGKKVTFYELDLREPEKLEKVNMTS